MTQERFVACPATLLFVCLLFSPATGDAAMAAPTATAFYAYEADASPVTSDDPATARPVGIGSLAQGGESLSLQVALNACSGPVDVYLAVQPLALSPDLFLFVSDGSLKPLSQAGLLPWKIGITAPVSEALLGGNIPVSALPGGVYRVFLGVTPKGSMTAMHLWQAAFTVGWWQEQEVQDKIMASFGEDGGFCAIALAADKGYSANQIVCAAMSDRLASSGAIATYSGPAEPPEYSPFNILTNGPEVMGTQKAVEVTLSALLGNANQTGRKPGELVFAVLLDLLETGYSPEQAFEGLLFGDVVAEEVTAFFEEIYIKDSEGRRVAPAFPRRRWSQGIRIDLNGDISLSLVGGEAKGSWTVNVSSPQKNCGSSGFAYAMNWGEGWVGEFKEGRPPFTVAHTFTMEGIYQVRACAGCAYRDESGNSVPVQGFSGTLLVDVKAVAPGCPVGFWDVTMRDVDPFWDPWDEVWEFKEDGSWEKWKWQAGCAWEGTWRFEGADLLMVDQPGSFPDCEYTVTKLNEACTDMEGRRIKKYQGLPNEEQTWTAKRRP